MARRAGLVTGMRSLALVAAANLRRRRGQGVLIGTILTLAALMLCTGIGLLREIHTPVRAMLDAQRASQVTMYLDARIHEPDSVRAWWRAQPGVRAVSEAMATMDLSESAFFRGRQLSRFLQLVERPVHRSDQDSIRIIEGRAAAGPGPGEIWLPTGLAEEIGAHAGDTLQLPATDGLVPLVVGAVVVDPLASSAFANPARVWVGAGELPMHFASPLLTRVIVAVRLSRGADVDAAWDRYMRALGGTYSGGLMSERDVVSSYTAPYELLGAVVVAFSALGFLVALLAVQGTITSAVMTDYRIIGILRAQGFRPVDVARAYLLQYLVLALVAIPIGVLAGVVLVRQAVAMLTRTVATPVPFAPVLGMAIVLAVVLLAIVTLVVARATRVAARVRPVDAIRFGASAGQAAPSPGVPLHRLRWASVPLIVAIRSLGQQKRRAAVLALAVVFATLASALAINLDYTFGRMTLHLAAFGFDAADVRVTRAGRRFGMRHEAMMEVLTTRAGVKAVATWNFMDGNFPAGTRGATRNVNGLVIDGDMAGLGYTNVRGRNPAGASEMSIGIRTAEEMGLDVGSTLTVQMLGAPLTLRVVGVFQSMNNTGHGFRVRADAVRRADPLWTPSEYALALVAGTDVDRFIAALEREYGEAVDAKRGDFFIRDQLAQIMTGLRMTNGFLALVFLIAAAVFIVNTTLLTIAEHRRVFGILKTTGMTPGQLRSSIMAAVGVQAVAGVLAALVLWFLLARTVLSGVFGTVGLVTFPLENWALGMAVMAPVIVCCCLASAWWPSRQVLAIDPRTLIVE
ncbi:MAG: ABC transporter permease [Gemmatimonadaceae bacterium]|nr:ABC transporter permease [Gemmatimonadaceae bacterium]